MFHLGDEFLVRHIRPMHVQMYLLICSGIGYLLLDSSLTLIKRTINGNTVMIIVNLPYLITI